MKKGLILILASVLSVNMILAQGFGDFSFGGLFSYFNVPMYLTALLFVTIFAVVYFILGKSPFRDNAAVCWIISLCASAFAIYGIESSGFSIENLIYGLGIPSGLLPTLLWMVALVVAIFLLKKFGFRNLIAVIFALLGALLIILSLLGVLYEQGAGLVIGAILLVIGLFLHKKTIGPFRRGLGKIGGFGWKGVKGAGKAGWNFGKWAGGKIPSKNILKSMKGISKTLKKLKKKYSKAVKNNDLAGAEDIRKQMEYLEAQLNSEGRALQEVQTQERAAGNGLVPQDKGQIKRSIRILAEEYNNIYRQNPRDPRLSKILDDIKELKRRL
jgi:hypothetical protein